MNPSYVIIEYSQKKAVCTLRAIPTVSLCMLRDIARQLARGEATPSDPSICDISRFGGNRWPKSMAG